MSTTIKQYQGVLEYLILNWIVQLSLLNSRGSIANLLANSSIDEQEQEIENWNHFAKPCAKILWFLDYLNGL